jgi:hypothetical protein
MFGGLSLDSVYIFYGHLEYFTDSWDILGPFDTFCVRLVQFFTVLVSCTKKIWQPCKQVVGQKKRLSNRYLWSVEEQRSLKCFAFFNRETVSFEFP